MTATLWRLYGKPYGWVAAALTLVPAVMAIATLDVRWAIVTLMVALLLIPSIMGLLYLNYSLSPRVAFNVLPHSLALTPEGLRISIFGRRKVENEAPEEPENPEQSEQSEQSEQTEQSESSGSSESYESYESSEISEKSEEPEFLHSFELKASEIGRYLIGRDYVVIILNPAPGFIYLPLSAFDSEAEMQEFLKRLTYEEKI